jgi:Cu/Zn superoxide dismutase
LARALLGTGVTLAALVAAPTMAGAQSASRPVVVANGPLTDYSTGTPQATDGARAYLVAAAFGDSTQFTFVVTGVDAEPGKTFGAHVHVGPCSENAPAAAGPHYRSDGVTPDPEHEVWLDVAVLPGGVGVARTTVPFVIPDGAARSVVIHQTATGPGGVAGARIACLPVGF